MLFTWHLGEALDHISQAQRLRRQMDKCSSGHVADERRVVSAQTANFWILLAIRSHHVEVCVIYAY
jgi:hypothetical protein